MRFVSFPLAGLLLIAAPRGRVCAQDGPDTEDLLTVRAGTLPIIVSAPHGGRLPIPGVPPRKGDGKRRFVVVRDTNTDALAMQLADAMEKRLGGRPFVIIARFGRSGLDVNRPAADAYETEAARPTYDAYHRALRRACDRVRREWGRGLLLDIHGQAADADTVFRGTGNGATVASLTRRFGREAFVGPMSVLGQMERKGYRIVPACASPETENARFNGGHIVQTYGSREGGAIDAIQLEFGGRARAQNRLPRTAADLADALRVFSGKYLPLREAPGDAPATSGERRARSPAAPR